MQPAAYGILDPGIVVRIHGGEPCPSHSGTPNPSSRFGVKAVRNLEVNLSPQWTPYGARCSVNGVPPLSRCAGTARSGKGAASAFNRAERAPSAITPTGLVTAAKPCMAGFDSRNRLSSDTSKAGRIHAAARVGLRRKEATCWSRRSSSSAFSSHYCSHGRCAASPPSATTKWTADSTTDTPA